MEVQHDTAVRIPESHLALHALAIKKHASLEAVAEIAGIPTERVRLMLDHAATQGQAIKAQERYLLSSLAQITLQAEYARFYAHVRKNSDFLTAYQLFERINTELKSLITDWQTVEAGGERIANDHSDRNYDQKIIERLGNVHDRVEPVLERLAVPVQRMALWCKKLETALARAENGNIEWVSDARIDSYHTVWFELHEDLLRVVGRARSE